MTAQDLDPALQAQHLGIMRAFLAGLDLRDAFLDQRSKRGRGLRSAPGLRPATP